MATFTTDQVIDLIRGAFRAEQATAAERETKNQQLLAEIEAQKSAASAEASANLDKLIGLAQEIGAINPTPAIDAMADAIASGPIETPAAIDTATEIGTADITPVEVGDAIVDALTEAVAA